ncbi:alkaline-phosphatase-like protein [Dichotomocladium elegans]|nr:alkaline-phosphatase-like protein [Dichotomocladium elegans]
MSFPNKKIAGSSTSDYGAIQPSSHSSNDHGNSALPILDESFHRQYISTKKIIMVVSILMLFGLGGLSYALSLWPSDNRALDPVFNNGTHDFRPTVILISLDGTVNHDLDISVTPHMNSMAERGVRAEWMTPSFPPITFPNHWTLVTGLYPESHGIVGNYFYDPVLNDSFDYHHPEASWNKKWWGGEPIWNTAVRQNKRSAVIMWPGCSTVFDNDAKPTISVDFDDLMTPDEKVDLVLDWLDLPADERPDFIGMYIPQVDQAGHKYGPYAKETMRALKSADASIGRLLGGLEARHLQDIVNVVVVSDHGMSATDRSQLIFYDDELTAEELGMISSIEAYPLLAIRPYKDEDTDTLYEAFKRLQLKHPQFEVYKRESIPSRYHFSHNPRIPPLLVVPQAGWMMLTRNEVPADPSVPLNPRGVHGYDNLDPQSRAIFVAQGPHFTNRYEPNTLLEPFINVEVYGLLANILGLQPAVNNGTLQGHLRSEV